MAAMSALRTARAALPRQLAVRAPTTSQATQRLAQVTSQLQQSPAFQTLNTSLTSASRSFSSTPVASILPSVDDKYKSRTVHELLSLKGKTTVITGGGRGIGLALARGCVEAGGNVAVLDALPAPHEDYNELKKDYPDSKVEFYQYAA